MTDGSKRVSNVAGEARGCRCLWRPWRTNVTLSAVTLDEIARDRKWSPGATSCPPLRLPGLARRPPSRRSSALSRPGDLVDLTCEARAATASILVARRAHVARRDDLALGVERVGLLAEADGEIVCLLASSMRPASLVASPSAIGSTPLANGSSVPPWPTLVFGSPAWRRIRLTALTAVVEPSPTGLSRMIQPWSIYRARETEAQLARFALTQPLEEMPAAQRDIAVVAADLGLRARGDRMALLIDTQVHRRLAAAFAHRLQFDQRVCERQQRRRTGKQLALEIRPQAIAEHRDAELVGDLAQLQHVALRSGTALRR